MERQDSAAQSLWGIVVKQPMNLQKVLDEIKANLTGDPQKDGPYLKEQADKYKGEEFSDELEREMADMLVMITEKNYKAALDSFLRNKNKEVEAQLEKAEKRFKNLNYNGGISILEEIIRNNIFAWNDTDEVTYKCFGTPLEYILYKNLFQEDTREVKPVNCDLARVYYTFCFGLMQKERYADARNAIERAVQLNPVDPEVYKQFIELAKRQNDMDALRKSADMLLKTAVNKSQVGYAYFALSFYFSELKQFDKALAMLQMSRIFRESDLYKTELEYIARSMGCVGDPELFDKNQLMVIMDKENIQPGPSVAVVGIANHVAKEFEEQGELDYAMYFYEIVYELTEDSGTEEHIKELGRKNRKSRKK